MKNFKNIFFTLMLSSIVVIASTGEGISERGKLSSKSTTAVNENIVTNQFKLDQNYPNPFNPSTSISFSVDKSSLTTLIIYNGLGEKITTLFNETAIVGKTYQINFISKNLGSGIYYYVLENKNNRTVKKMILMK